MAVVEVYVHRRIKLFCEGEWTMRQPVTKSAAPEQRAQQERETATLTAVKRIVGFAIIVIAVAALALTVALFAQSQDPHAQSKDKYSLRSPSGIAFSDFKGYEDWADVSSARTDDILKVIVANPTMIKAFKGGVPGNGQSFPDGSMIVKLQWKHKKSTEAPFVVEVPDVFSQAFVMEKDSKRFPKSGGWGYAVFNYEAASDKFSPDSKSLSDCGYACHTPVKAKDYIFHPYQKR
ncbi:MAG TPA: cytochrome P460 family protein [Terriglobales bacterium]|nr:cytochrome P460 family protein [Terriglobales bacterium]